jgi:acyl dehydratase
VNRSAALLFLDDLRPGMRFTSDVHRIEQADIERFAAEFDPQPFHLDPLAARSSVFGGQVASGWHTAAVSMRLLVRGGLPLAGGLIGLGSQITWPAPVRPGDALTVDSEVLAVKQSSSKPDRGVASIRSTTRNQTGQIVQSATYDVLVFRR